MPMPPRIRRWLILGAAVPPTAALLFLLAFCAYARWRRPAPLSETEIFQGVRYTCVELPPLADASGRMCVVTADLDAPGVEVRVTPMDPGALAAGWQHRMRWPTAWVAEENLAAALTATMFEANHPRVQLPGTWTRSAETVVADHRASHVDPNSYLFWIGDDGRAHQELTKPPSAASLAQAKWGVGGQGVMRCRQTLASLPGDKRDRRCVVGMDATGRKLFLAAFEDATLTATGRLLGGLGAEWALPMDGGASASLTLGEDARGMSGGPLLLPWRGVPTMIGIKARKLEGR